MTNTGKPYEALTEQVFLRLLAQQRVCANVRRDVKMRGKSGATHQIDVCFDFVAGSTTFSAIVQCKDWSYTVKQEQVLAFMSVLQDIPGQPRGIMVSRSGFQDGARTIARHHGIELYELREPKDEDWTGLFKSFQIEVVLQSPHYRNVTPCLDEAWMRRECLRLGIISEMVHLKISQDPESVALESGGCCDLRVPLGQHLPSRPDEWMPIRHEFPEGLMFRVAEGPFSLVRVCAVTADVKVTFSRSTILVSADHLVSYCFRDVLTDTIRFLDAEGGQLDNGHED